jgi:hypothetical protein
MAAPKPAADEYPSLGEASQGRARNQAGKPARSNKGGGSTWSLADADASADTRNAARALAETLTSTSKWTRMDREEDVSEFLLELLHALAEESDSTRRPNSRTQRGGEAKAAAAAARAVADQKAALAKAAAEDASAKRHKAEEAAAAAAAAKAARAGKDAPAEAQPPVEPPVEPLTPAARTGDSSPQSHAEDDEAFHTPRSSPMDSRLTFAPSPSPDFRLAASASAAPPAGGAVLSPQTSLASQHTVQLRSTVLCCTPHGHFCFGRRGTWHFGLSGYEWVRGSPQ